MKRSTRLGLLASVTLMAWAVVPVLARAACPAPSDREANYSCPIGPSYVIPALTNDMGWNQPSHYENIVYGDIDGDGAEEMVARSEVGTEVFRYKADLGQWSQIAAPAILPDRAGWSAPDRYRTLMLGDIDGDGRAELLIR